MTPDIPGDAAPPHPSDRSTVRPTVQAADVADLISYIQHTLGFPPTDSLTGITLAGHSLGAVLRCDWDAASMGGAPDDEQYARTFAGYLSQDVRADGCIVVLFRDRPGPAAGRRAALTVVGSPGSSPHRGSDDSRGSGVYRTSDPVTVSDRRLASALDRALRVAGLDLREMWLVTDGRTWHVDCPRPALCPGHGAPLSRVETSVVNASLIVQGSLVCEEPEGSGLPRPAEDFSPELTAALMQLLGPRGPGPHHTGPEQYGSTEQLRGDGSDDPEEEQEAQEAAALAVWLEGWERVLAGDGLPGDPWVRARLAAGLVRVQWRDCLMASAGFGLHRAVSGAAWWGTVPRQTVDLFEVEPREADGVLFTSVILGATRRPPDWDRIGLLRDACADLIPEGAGPVACALQCLVAWVEWARGRGSVAGRILAESRRDDPDYPLGQLLSQIVDRGLLSGWAGRRETAWSAIARGRG